MLQRRPNRVKNYFQHAGVNLDMTIELMQWIQQRNHKSYFSHREKNLVLKNI